MTFGFPEFQTKTQQISWCWEKALLALLRADIYEWCQKTDIHGICRLLMVEVRLHSAADVTLLFLINYLFNFLFAKRIGKFIGVVGERKALIFSMWVWLVCLSVTAWFKSARMGGSIVRDRSSILCSRSSNQNLLPENCRPCWYGFHCGCVFHYQSYCGSCYSCCIRCDLALFACDCVLHWCGNGGGFFGAVFEYSGKARREGNEMQRRMFSWR